MLWKFIDVLKELYAQALGKERLLL